MRAEELCSRINTVTVGSLIREGDAEGGQNVGFRLVATSDNIVTL